MKKALLAFSVFIGVLLSAQQRCSVPVNDVVFQQNFNQIAVLRGDPAKQERCVSFVNSNCVSSQQVKTLAMLFSADSVRLIFCKAAYSKVTDTTNFFNVYDAFSSFSYAIRMYDYTQHYKPVKGHVVPTTVVTTPATPAAPVFPNWQYPDTVRHTGSKGCAGPVINDAVFKTITDNVNKQPTEESKIVAIESASTNNCLSMAQVMKLSSMLTGDENRMRVMKSSFTRVYDQEDYQAAAVVFSAAPKQTEWNDYCAAYLTPPCVVSSKDFDGLMTQIRAKSFDDDQLDLAKQMSKDRCFDVAQLKTISDEFTFDDEKMELFKHCYSKCPDKQNYYQLVDKLTFPASKDELKRFINAGGK